jgi:SnoaL-like domain
MTATLTADDRLDIADLLYRIGAGLDNADADLLSSAFTEDATFDFGPAARFSGIDFPVLEGREQIVGGLIGSLGALDTFHQVTNPRITVTDGAVVLTTLIEAAHFPAGDHSRHFLMKNRHTSRVARIDGIWLVTSNVADAAWVDGDVNVLLGR